MMPAIGNWIVTRVDAHPGRVLAAVLAVAAVALLANSLLAPIDYAGPDGETYEEGGWEAATLGVFACGHSGRAFWSPGWIATVAFVYKAAGHRPRAVRVFLVVLALGTALLTYFIARQLAGHRSALVAALLFPFSKLVFRYTTFYQYEVLLALLVTACGFLVLHHRSAGRAWEPARFAVAGLLMGWAALVSPRVLAFVPLLALLLLRRHGRRPAITGILAATAGIAMVLVPWTIRNYRCYNDVIVTTTNGGINLYIGNNEHSTGGYHMPTPEERPPYHLDDSASWRREALRYMAAHPGRTAGRAVVKALRFWNPHYGDQFLVALLFVAGWVRCVRWRGKRADAERAWVLAAPFAMMAVHMIFFVQPRYMIPVLPFACIVAGAGVFGWRPRRPRSTRPAVAPARNRGRSARTPVRDRSGPARELSGETDPARCPDPSGPS
ncbi:MAG: ArnT family glycosyltransferase [Candidatus Krumholzibacteriia bacterium]